MHMPPGCCGSEAAPSMQLGLKQVTGRGVTWGERTRARMLLQLRRCATRGRRGRSNDHQTGSWSQDNRSLSLAPHLHLFLSSPK